MKVSVVLPNLNGAGWLEGCIESLYSQTLADFELIIVDNGSSDESLETARRYAKKENCFLIENSYNTGFSYAVNQGIRKAEAPYVMLFNNDAFAKPDMLQRLVEKIEQDEKIFSVQAHMLQHFEPEKTDDAGDFVTLFGWAFKRGDGLKASRHQQTKRVFSSCGGAALYRKAVFEKIGYFEENFFAYLEDVDIGWRANNAGYRNVFYPKAVCTHICGATTAGETGEKYNDFKSIQSGRNSLLLPVYNMPLLMLLINLPFLLLGYVVKTLVFHLRGFGKPWRQGMKEGFKLLTQPKKLPFKIKRLPYYVWVQGSLIASTFRYVAYRARRLFD